MNTQTKRRQGKMQGGEENTGGGGYMVPIPPKVTHTGKRAEYTGEERE
jgi:hypothetical protein